MRLIVKIGKIIVSIILVIILAVASLGIYATYIERNLLRVRNHEIVLDKASKNKVKVVQFSDTHLGEYFDLKDLEKVVRKINNENADIVVFTGDLIDNASQYEEIFNISQVLSKVEAKLGKYAVYGNHDIGGGAVRYYEDIMNEAGFEVLDNSSTVLQFNDRRINLLGGDDALMGNHDAYTTTKGIQQKDLNLLLLHEPDLIDYYRDYPIDLAFTGHSHGGQVDLPGYGPLVKNQLSKNYTKGIYALNNDRGTQIYVSSGLGNTKLPFRFGNIPAIEAFTLQF